MCAIKRWGGNLQCQLNHFPNIKKIYGGSDRHKKSTHVVRFRLALGFFSDSTPSFGYAGSNRKDDSSDKLDESALLLMLRKLDSPISLAGTVDAILIDGDV